MQFSDAEQTVLAPRVLPCTTSPSLAHVFSGNSVSKQPLKNLPRQHHGGDSELQDRRQKPAAGGKGADERGASSKRAGPGRVASPWAAPKAEYAERGRNQKEERRRCSLRDRFGPLKESVSGIF